MILKYIWKHKRHRIAKRIISSRNTARGITFPEFWLSYKTIAIRIAWCLHKNRDVNGLSNTADPNVSPCFYSHLSFDKEAKKHIEEETAFSANGAGQSRQLLAEEARPSSLTLHKTTNGSGISTKDLVSWFPLNHFSLVSLPAFTFWQGMSKDQVVPSTLCLGPSWADHTAPEAHFLLAHHESCQASSSIAQGCSFLQLLSASSLLPFKTFLSF